MFRAKRRTVVTVTAVLAVLLAGALAVTFLTQGKGNASDSTVEYQPGHRPLAPDFTATSLTGTTINLSNVSNTTSRRSTTERCTEPMRLAGCLCNQTPLKIWLCADFNSYSYPFDYSLSCCSISLLVYQVKIVSS